MTSEPAQPPIDYTRLRSQCGGDTELVEAVLESYRSDGSQLLAAIAAARAADDRDALARHAHSLKGLAAYLCADRLLCLSAWLEEEAEDAPAAMLADMAGELEEAHRSLIAYLEAS